MASVLPIISVHISFPFLYRCCQIRAVCMARKSNYCILQQCLLGSNNCLTKREMLPSMHLTETAVNVDVDSVGKAERQTKGIVMCVILWGLISLHSLIPHGIPMVCCSTFQRVRISPNNYPHCVCVMALAKGLCTRVACLMKKHQK